MSVIKLSCCCILKEVPPLRRLRKEIRGDPTIGKLGPRVVDKARIEARNKRSGDESKEDHSHSAMRKLAQRREM
jgi:hypothetical protein